MKKVLILLVVLISGNCCYYSFIEKTLYRGNNGPLWIQFDTRYTRKCLYMRSDSLYKYYPEYIVPQKYRKSVFYELVNEQTCINCDPMVYNSRRYYFFESNPKEIYEVEYFSTVITHIFYFQEDSIINSDNDWKKNNFERAKNRMEKEIIEKMKPFMDSTCFWR